MAMISFLLSMTLAAGCTTSLDLVQWGGFARSKVIVIEDSAGRTATLGAESAESLINILKTAKRLQMSPDLPQNRDMVITFKDSEKTDLADGIIGQVEVVLAGNEAVLRLSKDRVTRFYMMDAQRLTGAIPPLLPTGVSIGVPFEIVDALRRQMLDTPDPGASAKTGGAAFQVVGGTEDYLVVLDSSGPSERGTLGLSEGHFEENADAMAYRQAHGIFHFRRLTARPETSPLYGGHPYAGITMLRQTQLAEVYLDGVRLETKRLWPLTLSLCYPSRSTNGLVVEKRLVFREDTDVEALALSELIKPPLLADALPAMPKGTKLISASLDRNCVIADFSKELSLGVHGDPAAEKLAVSSIVQTLMRLPGVALVQILVEGQKLKTLSGHTEIDQPLAAWQVVPIR